MTTPAPDTATKKKRAALRVFGESIAVEAEEIDSSLTYSTGSEKSQSKNLINDENAPNAFVNSLTPPTKAGDQMYSSKSVSFAATTNYLNDRPHAKELFHCKRSPMRPDLVRRTQEAIRKATISVNETMMIGENEKESPQESKSEWQAQIEEARIFNDQMHESRLRMLALQKQLSSKGSREKARRHQIHKSKILSDVDKESQFKSAVYREHQRKLKEDEERRRRMSTNARAKLRANAKQGQERMRLRKIDEDMAIIEERHEASIAQRQKHANDAAARRKSFVFRNGDARRIRELHKLMEAEGQRKMHNDFSLSEDGHRDMQEYKRRLEEDRRKSLAFRNAMALKQRKKEQERQAVELEEMHGSYDLKFAADRDVDKYKKQLEEERRKSFVGRNEEARKRQIEENDRRARAMQNEHESYELQRLAHKDVEEYRASEDARRRQSLQRRGTAHQHQRKKEQEQMSKNASASHESFELKRAAEKDVAEYRKQTERERRQSLASRNQEGRRIRENESKRQNEQFVKEHKSYELKWAGEKDAEAYRRDQEKLRRESLAFRNQESRTQRKQLADLESARQHAEHKSFELKRNAAKDVEAYKKKVAEEQRMSLANRNKERARHANVMKELSDISRQKESESFALTWAAKNDVNEYMTKLKDERRASLQLRGEQHVHGREVEEEMRTLELVERHEDEKLRAEDQRAVKEYQRECAERDRTSLEYRGKEITRQRLEESVYDTKQRQVEAQNSELERQAQKDVEEYLKECQRRRRMSLALRAKESRRHAALKQAQNEKEIRQRRQLVHGRLMDQRYIELAQQEERARQALEAIRHTTKSSNPFSGLL